MFVGYLSLRLRPGPLADIGQNLSLQTHSAGNVHFACVKNYFKGEQTKPEVSHNRPLNGNGSIQTGKAAESSGPGNIQHSEAQDTAIPADEALAQCTSDQSRFCASLAFF